MVILGGAKGDKFPLSIYKTTPTTISIKVAFSAKKGQMDSVNCSIVITDVKNVLKVTTYKPSVKTVHKFSRKATCDGGNDNVQSLDVSAQFDCTERIVV